MTQRLDKAKKDKEQKLDIKRHTQRQRAESKEIMRDTYRGAVR